MEQTYTCSEDPETKIPLRQCQNLYIVTRLTLKVICGSPATVEPTNSGPVTSCTYNTCPPPPKKKNAATVNCIELKTTPTSQNTKRPYNMQTSNSSYQWRNVAPW